MNLDEAYEHAQAIANLDQKAQTVWRRAPEHISYLVTSWKEGDSRHPLFVTKYVPEPKEAAE